VTDRPLALGLVGCGRLAEVGYLPAVSLSRRVHLVAAADPDATRRSQLAASAARRGIDRIATFPDAQRMIEDAHLDAVVLATPAHAHVSDARRAAAAGVAVLVEKPPAVDADAASELFALSPTPWIGFNRRFDPGAVALRRAVPPTGELELGIGISYRRQSWRAHDVRDDALLDLGPHLVDWATWITGSDVVEVVRADLGPEHATVELQLERGHAVVSAATDKVHSEHLEVFDASGQRVGSHRLGGLVDAVRARVDPRRRPSALVISLARQLDAFASTVIDGGATELATAAEGVRVMRVIDAARASAATRRSVTLSARGSR
jgi:predicted dehydrogenase